MKILILGGTGAMGKPLIDVLSRDQDVELVITSRSHQESRANVLFLRGNARQDEFIDRILSEKYDAIVDFMNYDLDEFERQIPKFLSSTAHYIWFSSCRVYAESDSPLTEKSPRLLETSDDKEFLSTNRYALRKARQEDLLNNSGYNNFTIIRPYITYNDERLQLGILEKEQWLYRLLKGKPLIVSNEMLEKTTTLTYGNDVSYAVEKLICNEKALGETIQIAGCDTIKWIDLLNEVYIPILEKYLGKRPEIYSSNTIKAIEQLYEGGYNTIYDRNYNREFDSAKIESLVGQINYTPISQGIGQCLINFLNGDHVFRHIDPIYEAYQDILSNTESNRDDFGSEDDFILYKEYRKRKITEIEGLEDIKEKIS